MSPKRKNKKPDSMKKSTTYITDNVTRILLSEHIPFIDSRPKNGCLWALCGLEKKPLMDKLSKQGFVFHFSVKGGKATDGKPAWWTKDRGNDLTSQRISVKKTPSITPYALKSVEVTTDNKKDFSLWLKTHGYPDASIKYLISAVEKCGEFAIQKGITDRHIFSYNTRSGFREMRKRLSKNINFIKWDAQNKGKCVQAIDTYFKYLIDKDEESIKSNIDLSTEVSPGASKDNREDLSELLKDELYAPLRDTLFSQGITTVDQLKTIKLWSFMNQFNIYSIATRQVIVEKLREKLLPKKASANEKKYILKWNGIEFLGSSWADTFLHFCEDLALKYPLKFRSLIGKQIRKDGPIAIYKTPGDGHSLKMYNPVAYVPDSISLVELQEWVNWLCKKCAGAEPVLELSAPEKKENNQENINRNHTELKNEVTTKTDVFQTAKPIGLEQEQIQRVEKIALEADLDGILFEELKDQIGLTMAATKHLVAHARKLLVVKGKIYHEDAIIDWDEGAERLKDILEKLLQKNNGYVSAAQLYEYARVDMRMFLNDNDFDDERSVYDIAQHMFEDGIYNGKRYVFTGKMHISEPEASITSNFDIVCKYAEEQGGVFSYSGLIDYLIKIDIKTGNLRNQLHLYNAPDFFYYQEGVLISAKSMKIDDEWKNTVKNALVKLFDDVGDHIILREIQDVWYEQLPWLPGGRPWTPLLLQSILRFWGEYFNAKTIIALETQGIETLHAMLICNNSVIQNFGDAVVAYLLENDIEQRAFEAEELRTLLVKSKMIQGNELIHNMSKALGNDERFSWDIEGSNVTILV